MKRGGFTLIELMLVVAIVGLLATIAAPKFAGLVEKSREARVKADLGALRAAISIYYSSTDGQFPGTDLAAALTTDEKFLEAIPFIRVPAGSHVDTQAVVGTATFYPTIADSGGWSYASHTGTLVVDCSHLTSIGNVWSAQ